MSTRNKKTYPKIGRKTVRSEFEYAGYLKAKSLLPRGATIEYESEKLDYTIAYRYIPDVIVEFRDGRKLYIEFKGYFKYQDRAKMIAVKEANPELDIRFVFQKDQPSSLGRGSKSRPSDWARQYGFPFAIGEIPDEWITEPENAV